MTKNIGIIGAGNMGSAFYNGLSKKFDRRLLWICDHDEEKLQRLNTKQTSTYSNQIVEKSQVILIAIKPQSFTEWSAGLKYPLRKKLVISIMAGVSIKKIAAQTNAKKIIRCMPNLAAQIQEGMIGWISTPHVKESEKKLAQKMFRSLGKEIELTHEGMIDYITALSGSGPAYFFYVCEAMTEKARKLGFSKADSRKIIEQTFIGSAKLLESSKLGADELRKAVTSKGGTTEAAIKNFEKHKLAKIIDLSIEKAMERAQELGRS